MVRSPVKSMTEEKDKRVNKHECESAGAATKMVSQYHKSVIHAFVQLLSMEAPAEKISKIKEI